MKFGCVCGNVINGTVSPCSGLYKIYSPNEYIKYIDWIKDDLNIKPYPRDWIRAYYCEVCGRYYLEIDNKNIYNRLVPSKFEPGAESYTALHFMDEFEDSKNFEKIEEDKTIVPDTRMLYISYEDKRAYIVNKDGTKETFVIEEPPKKE